jgi:hypothetical protein
MDDETALSAAVLAAKSVDRVFEAFLKWLDSWGSSRYKEVQESPPEKILSLPHVVDHLDRRVYKRHLPYGLNNQPHNRELYGCGINS